MFSSAFGQLEQIHEWTVRSSVISLRFRCQSSFISPRTLLPQINSASVHAILQDPMPQGFVNISTISWAANGICQEIMVRVLTVARGIAAMFVIFLHFIWKMTTRILFFPTAHGCVWDLDFLPRSARDASRSSSTLFFLVYYLEHDRKWFPDLGYQYCSSWCHSQCYVSGKCTHIISAFYQPYGLYFPLRSPYRLQVGLLVATLLGQPQGPQARQKRVLQLAAPSSWKAGSVSLLLPSDRQSSAVCLGAFLRCDLAHLMQFKFIVAGTDRQTCWWHFTNYHFTRYQTLRCFNFYFWTYFTIIINLFPRSS